MSPPENELPQEARDLLLRRMPRTDEPFLALSELRFYFLEPCLIIAREGRADKGGTQQ